MIRTLLCALLLALPAIAAGHAGAGAVEADFSEGAGVLRVALDAPVEAEGLSAEIDLSGITSPTAIRRDPADPAAVLIALSDLRPLVQDVRWTVLSRDGHVGRGSARVLAPTGLGGDGEARLLSAGDQADGVALSAGRGLALAGLLIALGLVVLDALVLAPAWRDGGVRPPASALTADAVRRAATGPLSGGRRSWWTAWWLAISAAAAGAALWGAALGAALDVSPGDLFGATRSGVALVAIATALILAAGVGVFLARRDRPAGAVLSTGSAVALGAPLIVGLGAVSRGGHAATGPEPGLDVSVDLLHTLATAAWFGGLVGLALLLTGPLRRIAGRAQTALAAGVVIRFSNVAIWSVGALVVTGVYRALAELEGLGDLTGTGYGRWLLLKLVVFGVMLGLAVANRFVFHVRLERAALGLSADARGADRALTRSVKAELVLAALLLGLIAGLIGSAPPS